VTRKKFWHCARGFALRALPPTVGVVVIAALVAVPTHERAHAAATQRNVPAAWNAGGDAFPAAHRAVPTAAQATETSLRMEALLGAHAVLAADMMRTRVAGQPDFVQAANAALTKNTAALADLVGTLLGNAAKEKFGPAWTEHVTALFEYARGLAEHNAAIKADAAHELNEYEEELAGFFAAATDGRLPRSAAEAAMRVHVGHLLGQADAYAAKDYPRAAQLFRAGYAHAYSLGGTVAQALLPPTAARALTAPTWQLRSELGRLLTEHVELMVDATRAAVHDSPEFPSLGTSLDANTRELTGAFDTLFGTSAARRFQSLWADHIDQVMAYTAGVALNDAARRDAAVAKLKTFEPSFADFLAAGTGNRMGAAPLGTALLLQDEMLLHQVDAYAANDFQKAHDLTYEAANQMFVLTGQLSTAIGATIAGRLPRGPAQTGRGGMAATVGRR
jgi:hypothetical protein